MIHAGKLSGDWIAITRNKEKAKIK